MKSILLYLTFVVLWFPVTANAQQNIDSLIQSQNQRADSILITKEFLIDLDSMLQDKDIIWLTCRARHISGMKGVLSFDSSSVTLKNPVGVFHCLIVRNVPVIINEDTIYSGTWPTKDRRYLIGLRKSNQQITLLGSINKDSYTLWNPCAYYGTTVFKLKNAGLLHSNRFYYRKDTDYVYFKDRIELKKEVFIKSTTPKRK